MNKQDKDIQSDSSFKIIHLPQLLIKTYKSWIEKEPFKLGAVVAYYAILSLPALLILILNLVGAIWGREIVRGELQSEMASALGTDTATAILKMIAEKGDEPTSLFATILGIAVLLYGSTGVFYQLQNVLDDIWEVKQTYSNEIMATLIGRLKSFGFILIFGFLLLISFVLTALLTAFANRISNLFSTEIVGIAYIIDVTLSLIFIYILFGAMFKYLPGKPIKWKAVSVGAALTAVLFIIGKYILSFYFGKTEPGSTYGAAGSIIIVMLWTSYSSLILFFGAQFTKIYSDRYLMT
ncbi:YihY/virulence factor BrkB family protein [Mariniflexile litorale]|uniref:YihY/virulence factor BrkB family protein n=1 Tax=Mariniflexile litorale TaxID=3045158 RepID=A0AAU7EG64_9FLAO|nr:YihY/virulence factor BrkB family protein [Mariniflexile sp. KMM 9835]MDQ8211895.1 YihY/virulence factor BrkB family protein [Mariniflexile sp. KMM 9835]